MPANSLIFIVIVAIWAAYLLQYWIRRREQAASARSVDGFTKTMRVLQRRQILPAADLREPRPPSYTLALGRGARPSLDVKRARPAGTTRPPASRTTANRPTTDPAPEAAPMPMSPSTRPASLLTNGRRARQARALLLLASLVWVPVSVILAATSVIGWLTVPFALVMVAAVVFWLRTEAQAERSARRAAAPRIQRGTAEVLSSEETQEIGAEHLERVRRTVPAAARAPFDVTEHVTGPTPQQTAEAAPQEVGGIGRVEEVVAEGTWSPRPVPPPTYTMKARAPEPRLTAQGIPADVFETPEFAEEADELDERAQFARRAANG